MRKFGYSSDYHVYSYLRGKLFAGKKLSYKRYINDAQNQLSSKKKRFCSFVNSKKNTNGFPCSMFLENAQCSCPSEICVQFANLFKSPSSDVSNCCYSNLNNLFFIFVTNIYVIDALSNADESKGCDPDNILPVFLKRSAMQLAIPLQNTFNISLKSGTIHKTSITVLVFKSGYNFSIGGLGPIYFYSPIFQSAFDVIII